MGAADAALDGIPVGRDTRSIAARCFRTGRSQVVVDVISDPDYLMVDPSVRSQLHVLLRAGGRRLGVIVVSSDIIDGFSDNDARLLERAAAESPRCSSTRGWARCNGRPSTTCSDSRP
jgi:putative methionine-R-sulfoxide reductase with GAF domain